MIAAPSVIDEQNPWPGLGEFDEAAARFFNGRESDTATLRRLVLSAPLTVLFGASGLGKTSLIQAGLFPILRKEGFLPVRVRLDCRDRSSPLIDQVKLALREQINAWRIDAPDIGVDEPLWQYLHRNGLEFWSPQNRLLTPVFVLDQFEEVFTIGAENSFAVGQLVVGLADMVENRVPAAVAALMKENEAVSAELLFDSQRYRVLLSFREDFLPAVEEWKRLMPSILRNRLRLLPMSEDQAFRAIHDTAPHLVDQSLARRIVRFVAGAQVDGLGTPPAMLDGRGFSIEPALLSLVCEGLNQKRKEQQKPAFDDALLTGTGQAIVADFYERSVRDLPERLPRFIENELITERGYRKPCDVDDARSLHGVTDSDLRLLEKRRLLRAEQQYGTKRVELIHDLLTPVVRGHREEQRQKERDLQRKRERALRRKQQRTAVVMAVMTILCLSGFLVTLFAVKARNSAAELTRRTQQEKEKAQQENDRLNMLSQATSLRQDGERLRSAGKYADSLQAFQSALKIYEGVNDSKDQVFTFAQQVPQLIVSTLINVGDVLALMGSFEAAEDTYRQAETGAATGDGQSLRGKVLEALASLKERQDRLTDALKYYTDANQAYQKLGDSQASGRVFERLASEAEKSRALERAGVLYRDALKNYTDSGDELGKLRVQQAIDRVVGYWGVLVELLTGYMHEMRTDTVNVGRNVEGVRNDISFAGDPEQLVSRRHLAITRDLHVDDMRSRNGTTVNARLLPYGRGAKLSDGDIIALAGVVPLQFSLKKPPAPLKVPVDTWAVFIDGGSRSYHYLTGPEYFLTIENDGLLLQTGSSDSGLVKLRRGPDKPQMSIGGDWRLYFTEKETDYDYKSYVITKVGEWIDVVDTPLNFAKLAPDQKSIAVAGPAFQIVLVSHDSAQEIK